MSRAREADAGKSRTGAREPGIGGRESGAGLPRQPIRVVFDSRARLPLDSQLLGTLDRSPLLLVASQDADATRLAARREAGAEVLIASGSTPEDRIASALSELGRRNLTSLFLEGGRTLAAAFVEAGQVDEARVFVAPILLGSSGGGGPSGGVRGEGRAPGSVYPALPQQSRVEMVGEDALITARFREW
jgi:diaminohydroxyphosphoribosylaminopyrimidine deaminase/5-amino-6-(5-phosphoribosylamino)uracil reductase